MPAEYAADPALVAIERALLRIKRRQSRRTLGRAAVAAAPRPVNIEHVPVVAAVEEATERSGEVTVGNIAEMLGIDPSRASRIVAAAISAGYVRRIASQRDGRRICLELTPEGQGIVDHAHHFRQSLYAKVLSDWSEPDKKTFARLLARFTDSLTQNGYE